eukprot:590550-Amphidinium_carterae.1
MSITHARVLHSSTHTHTHTHTHTRAHRNRRLELCKGAGRYTSDEQDVADHRSSAEPHDAPADLIAIMAMVSAFRGRYCRTAEQHWLSLVSHSGQTRVSGGRSAITGLINPAAAA